MKGANSPALGDVADFIRGITFKPEDKVEPGTPGSVVCMRTKNIQHDLDEDDLIAVPASFVKNGRKYLREGDILISSANSWELVGKCCYVRNLRYNATAGGFISVVRAKNGTDARFLYHWLSSPNMQHVARHCGRQTTNISNLDVPRFLGLKFPNIAEAEQRRIAAILDKADAIRRKHEQALTLADDFLRSTFLHMFGDPVTNPKGFDVIRLEKIAEINSGLTKGRNLNGRATISLPYMRVANVQDGHIDLSDIKVIGVAHDEVNRFLLRPGDILLTEGGDPDKLGRGAVWRGEINPCVHQNHIFRVRCDSSMADPQFVSAQIGSARGKRYFLRSAKQTTGIASINKTQLREFPVSLPALHEQKRYAAMVEHIDKWRSNLSTALCFAQAAFSSLSQRAFRGEL